MCIPLQLQRLFGMLQLRYCEVLPPNFMLALCLCHEHKSYRTCLSGICIYFSNLSSIDTIALTKSFGWNSSEVFQQQDVQELCRVLFDALEDSFKGTEVDNIIDRLYAGELVDYLKCVGVEYQSERRDKFLDYSLAITPYGSNTPMHSLHECIEHFLQVR